MPVQIIGLKEANRALRRLPAYATVGAQKEMDTTAYQVARGAQARVRRRTGFLAAHIAWQSRPRTLSAVVGVARDSVSIDQRFAFYWKYLEYGTKKMPPSPFMRPAAEALRADHHTRLIKALHSAADRVEQSASTGFV